MKHSTFIVQELCCPSEEGLIRKRLLPLQGVERLSFNLIKREVLVTHTVDDERDIMAAIAALGMTPSLKPENATREMEHDHSHESSSLGRLLLAMSGITAILAEVLAARTGTDSSWSVITLAIASMALGGKDTFVKGLRAIRTFTLNINFLMTVAVTGAVAIGQWPEAAMVTFLFGLAEMIEGYSLDRARNAIRALMELSPERATVKDSNGEWREVDVGEVKTGVTVRVKPGERIPLDGTVSSGQSAVNQAPITGESIPVEKRKGDWVYGGSINERGSFEFVVTADKGHTTLDRIIKTVEEAQDQKAPTQRFVDRFSGYYTPVVVVLAVVVAVLPPLFFQVPFQPWLYKALVLLVIACPCALVISTPVTVVSGLAAAAKKGILAKGGAYLEEAARVRLIALDKTGTLTHGKPVVTDVISLTDLGEERVLELAASLDVLSEHPVASAIVAAWTNQKKSFVPTTDFESITGRGVKGKVGGTLYYVGNHRLAEENKVCSPSVESQLSSLERQGKTAVVLTSETEALGVIAVADTLRETSVTTVKELHDLGVKTVILTGDNELTAKAIADKVGIDDVKGSLLPEDKLSAIAAFLTTYGSVGMVGDGVNDAPALAKSSIGFAMGAAGTDTALETADVALMQDDLRKLPLFIALSRETSRVLRQNIAFSIGVKALFFILAVCGMATLWMAVFADMGASLLVVLNGLRLLRFKDPLAA